MKRRTLISTMAAVILLLANAVNGEVKLPAIVSSNMVLQRNTTITLWGWADAKEKITIEATWLNETMNTEADKGGNWRVSIKTTNSKEPQTIHIKSKTSDITLENVLFGEVWLCSGQSNMQQPVMGYPGQPTFGSVMTIARSDNPDLRLFTVDRVGSKTPLKNVEQYTPWQQASPENVPKFSAVAYYFGQQLQEILDVPVGMIHTSWGGSSVQAWISTEVMSSFETVNNSAFIREVQLQCLDLIPNSGIAITMDIGDDYCIHPPKKKEVANRLLFNALNQTYGYNTVDYAAPVYESQEAKDGGIVLRFINTEEGLYAYDELEGFEIAGEDKVFYPAEAEIVNRKEVFIKSDKVPNPVAVRYAWRNWVVGTLYDAHLLPASSFRTDNWDYAIKSEQ